MPERVYVSLELGGREHPVLKPGKFGHANSALHPSIITTTTTLGSGEESNIKPSLLTIFQLMIAPY